MARDRIEGRLVPSILNRELEISLTQPSQVIGTAKVVWKTQEGQYALSRIEGCPGKPTWNGSIMAGEGIRARTRGRQEAEA